MSNQTGELCWQARALTYGASAIRRKLKNTIRDWFFPGNVVTKKVAYVITVLGIMIRTVVVISRLT
nr:hypothetical protein [Pectobacterium parmentieri]